MSRTRNIRVAFRVAPGQHDVTRDDLKKQITTAAFAFRGYDASNLGRGPELLEHPVYGPFMRTMLDRASVVAGDVLKAKVDLAARVHAREAGHARDASWRIRRRSLPWSWPRSRCWSRSSGSRCARRA